MNLGILAHVDAGKTSLTERLLFTSGAIDAIGSVDTGTTRTDALFLEQQRGITIRSTVTSIVLGDRDINIIDTPGHSDFIAEVERSLGVLDCAVLVLSAIEGVQPQTVILWRALRRVGIPTVLFINKVDRGGANPERIADQIRERLSPRIVVLNRCNMPGTKEVVTPSRSLVEPEIVEAVAQQDSELLDVWAEQKHIAAHAVIEAMRRLTATGQLFPIVLGSAITGTGLDTLEWVLTNTLSPIHENGHELAGTVFAVDHNGAQRRTWVRIWTGTLRVRDRISIAARKPARVTQLVVPTPRGEEVRDAVGAGDIVSIRGPVARIGDSFGSPPARTIPHLSPPTLQTTVTPADPRQRGALYAGLSELAEEDPLIGLDLDKANNSATVRIHGEVQKEVIGALLEDRYGVIARFEKTSVVCVESVAGTGDAIEEMGRGDNPYLATIGLQIERAPEIIGIDFSPGIERGNLPAAFVSACEEGVRAVLSQGLYGWQVTGCRVTMTSSGYAPRQSHSHQKFNKAMSSVGADFRNLAPVVAMACLEKAKTQVCEPIERFDLEVPTRALNTAVSTLARFTATLTGTVELGRYHRLEGFLPSRLLPDLLKILPNITEGEGVFTSKMDHYAPTTADSVPKRRRVGTDPRDRITWFRDMQR